MKYFGLARAIASVAIAVVSAIALQAQEYPSKPVTVISGYTPATPSEIIARILLPKLQEELGQPFVIESKVGATGQLAEDFVSRASPDGYTLLAGVSSLSVKPAVLPDYTAHETLRPVAVVASSPVFLYVRADSPFQTVEDAIAAAKAEPGKYTFGTTGIGGGGHLATEILMAGSSIELLHVPYKGSADVSAALMAGDIDFRIGTVILDDDRVRALLVFDTKRMALAPEVPSVLEAGLSGFFPTFYGTVLMAPVDTPDEIVNTLYDAVAKVLVPTPELQQQFALAGSELNVLSPAASEELIASSIAGWTRLVEELGLEIQ